MQPVDDLSFSLVPLDQESALVAVIELSNASWLVAGTCPASALQQLLTRWRIESEGADRSTSRIILAYEAGRDGFWRLLYIPRSGPAMVTVGLYR